MKKISKNNLKDMSLKEIFEKTNAIFYETDISNFCDDIRVINRFILLRKKDDNYKKIIDFLIENEDKIDKEKLVFNIYLNYSENIPQIEQTMDKLCKEIEGIVKYDPEISKIFKRNVKINNLKDLKMFLVQNQDILTFALKNTPNTAMVKSVIDRLDELAMLESELANQKEYRAQTRSLLKDTDVYIDEIDLKNNHLDLKIFCSKEEYEGKHGIDRKKKSKLDKIDRTIGDENNGLLYVVQPLVLTDLEYIMPDKKIGEQLRENILCNSVMRQGEYTFEDLEEIKQKDYKEYERILQNAPREIYLSELRQEIINNSKYIDLDRMFLISVYRFEEYIEESKNYDPQYYKEYRNLAFFIMNQIENSNVKIHGNMQRIVGGEKEVEYSFEDAENFMQRLTEEEYITKEKVIETKRALLQGEKSVKDIPTHILPVLDVTNEELDQIINISTENAISIIEISGIDEENIMGILNDKDNIDEKLFDYIIRNKKISIESVMELYAKGKINSEHIKKYAEYISKEITIDKIDEKYKKLKANKNKDNQEETKLDNMIKIYKIINIDGKEQEEQEEAYNDVMYEIAEDFEDEDDALYYYKHGLISIDIVAEWCGEQTIEKWYEQSKINKDELEKSKKISQELKEKLLLIDNISYDELMSLILNRTISESKIVDLYMQGRIFDVDFEEMLNNGIISHEEFFTATELRTQEKLEETSSIKLSPVLKNIPNKKDIIFNTDDDTDRDDDWFKPDKGANKKTLIHPGVRYEFLEALGAKKAEVIDIDEDNAFYNYEFFVIPNKEGTFDLNSVVIAERIYINKDIGEEGGYALDNATYFFQYKDLMVNSNLSKQEMTKERDKIVFRANHRSGSWAISVLQKVAQTMLSTKFADCTTEKEKDERAERILEQLDKILIPKQIKKVLDLAGEIDDEEKYTYDVISSSYGSKKSNDTNDDNDEITI